MRIGSAALTLACVLALNAEAAITISPDHPELLQPGILEAYNSGKTSIVIPAGIYQVPVLSSGRHLDLENITNFEIDARGATFIFQDQTATGIFIVNCDRLYFHGATMYYATPPFSQGTITAVASDRSSFDVQIEKGYPTNLDNPKYFFPQITGHLFDSSTRWWKHGVYGDAYGSSTQRLGTDTFRIFTPSFQGSVGDLIGFRSGTGDHIIRMHFCSRTTLSNLTVYNSPVFTVADASGGTLGPNHFLNITVMRGPRPAGAVTDPLFSTSADGIHILDARSGPDIENCYLEAMADDGIAVHGQFSWVMEAAGNTLIVSNTRVEGQVNFAPGDPLRLIDASDNPAGEAIVTGISPLPNYQNSRKSARQTYTDLTLGPYYQITLDRNVTAGFDYLASNPSASGAGFAILNNTIKNHRARGINVKADNGLIQGNTIDGSTMAGIRLGPEFYFGESSYNRNVTIRNNTISNVAYWGGQTAALLVAPEQGHPAFGSYRDILIDGNTFQNFDITAIFLSGVSGATVTNNTFRNLQNAPAYLQATLGESVIPGALVYVTRSSAAFQNNTQTQLGPLNIAFVQAAATASVEGTPFVSVAAGSTADFSGTQGANGWYYGYFPAGNVNAFTQLPFYNAQANRWQHVTFGPPWTLLGNGSQAHPNATNNGQEEWAVRRWVSNTSGAATITGHLAKNDTHPASLGVYGRIYLNHTLIYEHFLAGTDGVGLDYSVKATLHGGDTLDFALAPNMTDTSDSTNFSSVIYVNANPASNAPIGVFDTPSDNAHVTGAVGVTGWALDPVQVQAVKIYREPPPGQGSGLLYVGDAVFIPGARPDVYAAYQNYPFADRAGWGIQVLTNELPNGDGTPGTGNGTYKLHAIATNFNGQTTDLGAKTIVADNVHATLPFGTLDTPAQGATISGSAFVNFGWALTPNPANVIPKDGSTIQVFIDNMPVGRPVYNQFRADIATLFPGLQNSAGAIGYFVIDTTKLANGLHTIAWNVTDSAGGGQGIGSRYFTVQN